MKAALIRVLAGIMAAIALAVPMPGYPQAPVPFSPPQLDQMLAPIALYPDPLLGQVLMAATYPLEVVAAARWLQEPGHAGIQGDQLAVALQSEDWDPSVKSLVPFPQILGMMNGQLGWMQQLGDAFMAQQADVVDSVQRLRAKATAAGTLYSTPAASVSSDGTTTTIEPADPQFVYVPAYDPATMYGDWPSPEYPPDYFPPYPGYGSPVAGGIDFGFAVSVVIPLWGWDRFDWRRHRIHIDADRYNAINRYGIERDRQPRTTSTTWEHDPLHRRGVAYRDQQSWQRAHANPGGTPDARRPFRGFEGTPSVPPSAPPAVPRQGGHVFAAEPTARPAPVQSSPPPAPIFGDIGRGHDARRESERGRASRESAAPAHREPAAAPRPVEPFRGTAGGRPGRRER